MEPVHLTESEYSYALSKAFYAPRDEMEISVNIPPHCLTDDAELNRRLCKNRVVRFKRAEGSSPEENSWKELVEILKYDIW